MINLRLLIFVVLTCAALAWSGFSRLEISSDVLSSLPLGEKNIADSMVIFQHHPIHDQIAVDITFAGDPPGPLLDCGRELEKKMRDSGLFSQVGSDHTAGLLVELAIHAAHNLPLMFSREELEDRVAPLLTPASIHQRLQKLQNDLNRMEGIGQAIFMERDPLGLKDLILARLAPLAPSADVRMDNGHLLSADRRHLLVTAKPRAARTNTAAAAELADFFTMVTQQLRDQFAPAGTSLILTPVGAYRAALDNERIIRRDVEIAIWLSTGAIALLLLLSFPRPLIGLLSLVPALAGTAAALFVFSLFHRSISIIALGFGGAIISITVDYGIAYLLFLDQPSETIGKETSREVGAISIMIVFTTMGAFLLLGFSGFPLFMELGRFAALGQFFAFVFVHFVFPVIFPVMPAGSPRALPLRRLVDLLYSTGKPGALAMALLALGLLFFARPQFQVSLHSMNTVSAATEAADAMFTKVWGNDASQRILLMRRADSIETIQHDDDALLALIEEDIQIGLLASGFIPAMLFPGETRGADNLAAWRSFWNQERVARVTTVLDETARQFGFAPDGFMEFLDLLDPPATMSPPVIADRYYTLLGITADSTGPRRFASLKPGHLYDSAAVLARYAGGNTVFDTASFTAWLGKYLFSSFSTLLLIVGSSMTMLLLIAFLHPTLTLLTLLPAAFSFICTLGTLRLFGHPLDIPALMLSVVILGMGIDYAVLCVRAHQRYRDVNHPSYGLTRSAAFLAGSSNLIAFGVLCFAEHSLLRSIGLTSLLGIGYCMLGTFFLLPPLLRAYFQRRGADNCRDGRTVSNRILCRFRTLEAYPRLFARIKLSTDPMFQDLPRMLSDRTSCPTILDIGCGYGVPACWCLEYFADARISALEPDPERVRVARLALGLGGTVIQGKAPEMPPLPETRTTADIVLVLDMFHYLDDTVLALLLLRSSQALTPGGILVARFALQPPGQPSLSWRLENYRAGRNGVKPRYRGREHMATLFRDAGFQVTVNIVSANNPELAWMVGQIPQAPSRDH